MMIVTANPPKQVRISEEFLAPYYYMGDPFKSLLARSTYLTKYSRNGEAWTDTIRRVVEGNVSLAPYVSNQEAEKLFHFFWTGQALPPGRGLWTGGVEGIPSDARYNCWYTTLYGVDDWCWTANQLMLGGGVGVGLAEIGSLPIVSKNPARLTVWCNETHVNIGEVKPDARSTDGMSPVLRVPDSREGWVEALRAVLNSAFEGKDLTLDVSDIRARGLPIRTFGGIACGPGPLVNLLRNSWDIVRAASGRKLSSVEALDITNYIGLCIKAGNVRRSALIVLGDAQDQAFRDAKKDFEKVVSHRHTSNNSIVFRSWEQIANFDWSALVEDNIEYGEPGLLNLPLVWASDPGAKGVNPCFTGDTRIASQFGMVTIKDLVEGAKALKVTTDSRVTEDYGVGESYGTVARDAAPAFKTSDSSPVFRVTTRHGYSVTTTEYHKFVTPGGFAELKDLQLGDKVLLQSDEGQWGSEGNEDLGCVIGLLEGDGNFTLGVDATLRFWGEDKPLAHKILPAVQRIASTIPALNGREYTLSVVDVPSRDSCEIGSERLCKALAEYGYRQKGSVPEVVWRGSRDMVRGYLRGLWAADGQVNWSKDKQSFSTRLSQSNPVLLRETQQLLLNFGIVSKLYPRREAGWRRLPDGKAGMKDYWCQPQFDLVVEKQNAVRFEQRVGFLMEADQTKFDAWKATWQRGPYKENFLDEIVSIEFVGMEPVYCTTQASHHTVIANGVVTGQCGEQALHDREACNLAEVFPAFFEEGTNPTEVLRLVTRYCLRQRLTPLTDPKSQAVGNNNMRVGVGLGGLCDFEWTRTSLRHYYGACRDEANRYAEELGVKAPITVTTVKPSGTISLLNGSSPGIHAPYAPYYIRRTRIAKNDPLAAAMIEAKVPHEEDIYDKTGFTWVFSFPTKAPHTKFTVQTETIRDQFERQKAVQEAWADNAVSATLSFERSEKEELAECLREYVPFLKSTSVLNKVHGYSQPPYEVISEEQYASMYSTIDHKHPLTRGGEMEVEECVGGVCPTR